LLHVLPVLGYQENPGTFAMAEGTAESAQRRMRDLRDSCPPRSRHYFLWVLSCGGILLDGITLAALAISLPLIRQSFPMSAFMVGAVSSGAVEGMAIGAIFGGRVSDRIGRRRSFLFSMSLITVTATSSAFAWDPSVILLTQFLIGCGQGSEFPNSSAYVSEIMPTRVRNRMLVATITTQAVGMLVGVSLGYLLLQASPEVEAWRYFLGSRAAVGALLVVLRLLTMPESPIWLMHRGQNAEAAKVLASLRPDDEKELAKLGSQAADQRFDSGEHPKGRSVGLSVLFSPQYRRLIALTAVPWFLMDIANYGVGYFSPSVLANLASGNGSSGPIAAEFAAIEGSFSLDGFLLLGFLLALWLVPRAGEIRMQGIGFLGMVVGMGILVVAVGGPSHSHSSTPFVIVGFSVSNLMMNLGPNSTTFGLPALAFPSEIRATAAGFSAACGKIGATCGTLFLPMLTKAIGLQYTLALLAGLSGLGYVVTTTLGARLKTRASRPARVV
jgi:putative MFS transporter